MRFLWVKVILKCGKRRANFLGEQNLKKQFYSVGPGGGQVVSVLAFSSVDPSSNPADAYSFSVNFVFEKNENKQKRGRVGPIF